MKKILATLLALSILMSGCLGQSPVTPEEQPPQDQIQPLTTPTKEPRQVTLRVEGMFCPACPKNIETTLLQREGIIQVEASYPDKTAIVVYDSSKITKEDIVGMEIFSPPYPFSAEVIEDRGVE